MLLYLRILYKNIRKYSSERRETGMPSKPVLSDADKENIRKKLKGLCEECWISQGYKKTSIKSLCERAGISVGTFYTLYQTKEDLFFETIETIQRRLEEKSFEIKKF